MKNKNFCATISETFSTELDALAAKFGIKTKAQLLSFFVEQTTQNIELKEAQLAQKAKLSKTPLTMRSVNIPYLLECYICAALQENAPITKQAAQNYVAAQAQTTRINGETINTILAPYAKEIAAHAAAHNYAESARFVKFLAVLNDINLQSK
jgi:hypothetical protein